MHDHMTRCKRICRTADALKKARHTKVATARIVMALELSGTYPDISKISISLSTDLASHTKLNRKACASSCFTTAFFIVNGSREQLSLTFFQRYFLEV